MCHKARTFCVPGGNLAEDPTQASIRQRERRAPFKSCFAQQGGLTRFLLADDEHETVKGPFGREPFAQGDQQMLVEIIGYLGRADPKAHLGGIGRAGAYLNCARL